jgi:hypothetical protein
MALWLQSQCVANCAPPFERILVAARSFCGPVVIDKKVASSPLASSGATAQLSILSPLHSRPRLSQGVSLLLHSFDSLTAILLYSSPSSGPSVGGTKAQKWKTPPKMSFINRKFSMNRNTGSPRLSTKIQRRFSTHDPSANGMFVCFSFQCESLVCSHGDSHTVVSTYISGYKNGTSKACNSITEEGRCLEVLVKICNCE